MLANKENVLVHGPSHGAGKINPKTPGPARLNPKTPFKVTLNDDKFKIGKNDLFTGNDPSMFVTPAGPRRAALTGKTTNAKARLAPQSGRGESALQKTGRLVHTQLSTTTETLSIINSDGEAPEIEYMPPRELALPDIPDDFQIPDYAKLSTHVFKECHRSYLYDIDESGKSAIEREVEASDRQMAALLDAETELLLAMYKPKRVTITKKAAAAVATKLAAENVGVKSRPKRSTALTEKPALTRKRTTERSMSAASNNSIDSRPSTAASIRAATALSQRPASSASLNRPSASTTQRPAHSRSSSTTIIRKPTSSRGTEPSRPASRTNSRPNSRMAAANSKTTIGYATGKEVARSIRKVLEVPKMETALEVCERILREDDERQSVVPVMRLRSDEEEDEEEEIDDILKSLGPIVEDEEEFFISIPELE